MNVGCSLEYLCVSHLAELMQHQWNTSKKLIVYHTNWATYDRNFQVADLPIDQISDINYAFLDLRLKNGFYVPTFTDPWADFEKPFGDARGNLQAFQKLNKPFNFGISIGGWTCSKNFSTSVSTPESRHAFIMECIDIIRRFPWIVRIDLDWEYISPAAELYGETQNVRHPNDGTLELSRDELWTFASRNACMF